MEYFYPLMYKQFVIKNLHVHSMVQGSNDQNLNLHNPPQINFQNNMVATNIVLLCT